MFSQFMSILLYEIRKINYFVKSVTIENIIKFKKIINNKITKKLKIKI